MTPRPERSPAEWTSLVASAGVVLLVIVLILLQIPGDDLPAAPVVEVEGVRQVGEVFHVDVTVRNDGDATAAAVQVVAELVVDDTTYEGEQTVDYLSEDENHDLVFVFDNDPDDGELDVKIASFAIP